MGDCLSISVVIYYPDETLLKQTLQTLFAAASKAETLGLIDAFYITIVDNSETSFPIERVLQHIQPVAIFADWRKRCLAIFKPGNVGYGAGHNIAIRARCETYHLVINPDVLLHEDAVITAIHYLQQHPQAGLVTPFCSRTDGQQEYLCKAYPSLWILLLRGFAPQGIKLFFRKQLTAYELRSEQNVTRENILIASGCFMFFRYNALQQVQGFCEAFFLYFEDFDISIRLTQYWRIAYVPDVRIVHYGGHSAKKGFRHIVMFVCSAMLFFKRHGWRFW